MMSSANEKAVSIKLSRNERAGLEALYEAGRSGARVVARGPVSGTTVNSLRAKGLVEVERLNPKTRWATILPEGSACLGKDHPQRRFVYMVPDEVNPIPGHGYRVAIVNEGEGGYRWTGTWPYDGGIGQKLPYFWGATRREAEDRCETMNAQRGISLKQAADIIAKSMGRGMAEGGR